MNETELKLKKYIQKNTILLDFIKELNETADARLLIKIADLMKKLRDIGE